MRSMRLMAINLVDVELFERIASLGSIAAAARELRITPSNATRRLASLEQALDVRLINRSTRRMALTSAGNEVIRWARDTLQNLDDMTEELATTAENLPSGRIRIAVPHFGMMRYLPKLIAEFSAEYPQIILDICTTDSVLDVFENKFDIILRCNKLPDTSETALKITSSKKIVCASPTYIAQYGRPDRLDDLSGHQCIVHRHNDPPTWPFRRGKEIILQSVHASIEVDSDIAVAQLCMRGGGIARLAKPTIQTELDEGRLVQLFPDLQCVDQSGEEGALWLVHVGQDLSPRARILVNYLQKEILAARNSSFNLH